MPIALIDAPTPRQAALTAGVSYVFLSALALFANFLVLERLTVAGDPAATAHNIAGSELLFRGGVAAFTVVFIADAVVAWGLYVFLRPTSRELSLLTAWLRLIYAAVAGAALVNLLMAARSADDTVTATVADGQRDATVMGFLDAYTYGWSIALVCFGCHLVLLGLMLVKADYVPSALGVLVAVAGAAYVVGKLASVVSPDHDDAFLVFIALVAIPGEFGLMGWLLWRGGKKLPAIAEPAELTPSEGVR
jgi:hypothetical protein